MSQSPSSLAQSQRSSPSHSDHRFDGRVSVETLISWLVAAKRSLSNIQQVHRATGILSEARYVVESATAVIARTKYLRRSLESQLKILRGIQYELEAAAQSVNLDIQTTLKQLRDTETRLTQNIDLLQRTKIENGFKLFQKGQDSQQDVVNKETLHDFVDDNPVQNLRQRTKHAIHNTENAQSSANKSIQKLEDTLQNVNDALSDKTATSSSTRSDLQQPHVPILLKALETHAREMAESLESLVKHFDLCVTAIKHTEGGGAAVARTIDAEDLPEGVGVEAFEKPIQPITEDERTEMLAVLENDAAEVDDVVTELQERGAEMETQLEQIMNWKENSQAAHHDIATAFRLLEEVGLRLSGYIAESSRFAGRWIEEKVKIGEGIASMEELNEVYDNFLSAYDSMIVEAARRRTVRKRMEKIVNEAQAQIDQLYEEDLNERDLFRSERGDYLPSDIWQGLDSLPARFGFQRLTDDGFDSVPDLSKDIVAGALKRLKAAQGLPDKAH